MKLTKKSEAVLKNLVDKYNDYSVKFASVKDISTLLSEVGISHEFKEITERRITNRGSIYLNSFGGTRDYEGYLLKVGEIEINTVQYPHFKKNQKRYNTYLVELIRQKLKEKEDDSK